MARWRVCSNCVCTQKCCSEGVIADSGKPVQKLPEPERTPPLPVSPVVQQTEAAVVHRELQRILDKVKLACGWAQNVLASDTPLVKTLVEAEFDLLTVVTHFDALQRTPEKPEELEQYEYSVRGVTVDGALWHEFRSKAPHWKVAVERYTAYFSITPFTAFIVNGVTFTRDALNG